MHSLAPYTVRVYDRTLAGPMDEKYHKLGSIRGKDLLSIIKDFAESNKAIYQEIKLDSGKKTVKFSDLKVIDRTIYGLIEYGEYGIKGKVVNIPSGSTVYSKKKDDSDISQLYFNFTIPKNETKGVCLFHNIHGRGVKGIIDQLLNEYFHDKTKGLKIQIRPLTYEKAVEDWMKHSKIKELRLTKYSPKSEVSDQVDQLAENTVEIKFKPKEKGGSFGSFWDFSKSKNRKGRLSGAVDILEEYCTSVKAVVEFEGRKRVFSLSSEELPVSSIDFDEDDVKMDEGAPMLNSLHEFSTQLIDDILSTM